MTDGVGTTDGTRTPGGASLPPPAGAPAGPPQADPSQPGPPRTDPSQAAPTARAPYAGGSPYLAGPAAPQQPDWAAMAEQHEEEIRRRKRLRVIGASVLATALIGGMTATAITVSDSSRNDHPTGTATLRPGPTADPTGADTGLTTGAPPTATATAPTGAPGPTGTASGSPTPSPGKSGGRPSGTATPGKPGASATQGAPPPAAPPAVPPAGAPAPASSAPRDPLTVISEAATDTAPLDPGTLFAAPSLTVGGRTWNRIATSSTDTCWQATTGGLGDVASGQSCRKLLRATYTSGDSAVTVGVAVFDHKPQADAVGQAHKGQIQGLTTPAGIAWCVTTGCANTHTTIGRYGYYTVSGTYRPGGTTQDAAATAAGPELAAYARTRLLARGQAAVGV
ncbi:hypothetical protein ACIF6L_10855 [Kitasatospora sp. NPDC086009]|uniref:hypothetical protein n=1 Tax=unclassified Kitasatospora TaxID=2633591 RepID=UPI0037C6B966